MYCQPNKEDHPARARIETGGYRGVVHAVRNVGPYKTPEDSIRVRDYGYFPTACGLFINGRDLISNTEEITCKNCQRALGFHEKEFAGGLYHVLYDKINELYFSSESKGYWTESLLLATRWLTEAGAVGRKEVILRQRFSAGLDHLFTTTHDHAARESFMQEHWGDLEIQTVQLQVCRIR